MAVKWYAPSTWFKKKPIAIEVAHESSDFVDGNSGRRAPPVGGRGWAGIPVYNGRASGLESNPEIRDPARWAAICREMVNTDSTIAGAWEATSSTLLAGQRYAEPGDETNPLSVKMADLLNQNLGLAGYPSRMNRSFESCLSDMLGYLLNGFRYGEIGWDIDDEGQYYITDAWLDRDPAGHDRWDIDPGTNRLLGVWQRIPSGDLGREDHCPYIPGDELVYLGRHARGSDYNGTGMLRPCYFPWKAKEDLVLWEMAASETNSRPTPNVVVDYIGARIAVETSGGDWEGFKADFDANVAAVRESAINYALGITGVIESTPYVRIEEWGTSKHTPGTYKDQIAEKDNAILMAFLLQFLRLGVTDTGSRAVGETHASVWRRSLINILDYVLSQWGRVAIPHWVKMNFGNVPIELHPVMKHSGLEVDTLLEVLDKLPALLDKNALGKWGDADTNALRRRVGLDPEVKEDDKTSVLDELVDMTGDMINE